MLPPDYPCFEPAGSPRQHGFGLDFQQHVWPSERRDADERRSRQVEAGIFLAPTLDPIVQKESHVGDEYRHLDDILERRAVQRQELLDLVEGVLALGVEVAGMQDLAILLALVANPAEEDVPCGIV